MNKTAMITVTRKQSDYSYKKTNKSKLTNQIWEYRDDHLWLRHESELHRNIVQA